MLLTLVQKQNVKFNGETSNRERTKCTSHQAQVIVLDKVQNMEGTKESSTINMKTVIQFKTDTDDIKTNERSPISARISVGQVRKEIKITLTFMTQGFEVRNPSEMLVEDHTEETDLTNYR